MQTWSMILIGLDHELRFTGCRTRANYQDTRGPFDVFNFPVNRTELIGFGGEVLN